MEAELTGLVKQFAGGVVEHAIASYISTLTPEAWDAIIQALNTLAVAAEGRNAADASKALVTLALKFI